MLSKVSNLIAHTIATCFGLGWLRPGATIWTGLITSTGLFFIFPHLSLYIKALTIVGFFIVGTIAANRVEQNSTEPDPHYIVIDEVVGLMITSLFLNNTWWQFAIALFMFGLFDYAKLWPASSVDKQEGGLAIMLDDVIMALPALFCTHVIIWAIEAWWI